jgi:hypothetical protein
LPRLQPTNDGSLEGRAVLKRFVLTFLAFIGLIVPAALLLALLVAPASPAPLERPGCERTLADTVANVTDMQAHVKSLSAAPAPAICNATRLYFLEVVKARGHRAVQERSRPRARARPA